MLMHLYGLRGNGGFVCHTIYTIPCLTKSKQMPNVMGWFGNVSLYQSVFNTSFFNHLSSADKVVRVSLTHSAMINYVDNAE